MTSKESTSATHAMSATLVRDSIFHPHDPVCAAAAAIEPHSQRGGSSQALEYAGDHGQGQVEGEASLDPAKPVWHISAS